jgi:putative oxidoreductase
MFRRLMMTDDGAIGLIARVFLGLVILPHGMQKLLGWFGGAGLERTIAAFEQFFGMPAPVTVLVILAESFGALGLILGFQTRICAMAIFLVMLGAIFIVHVKFGFFMNWFGFQNGEGFEFHLLALGLALIVLIKGGGKGSFDRALVS